MVTFCPGCHLNMGFSWVYSSVRKTKTQPKSTINRWECKHCGYLFNTALTYKIGMKIGEDDGGSKMAKVLKKLKLNNDPPSIYGFVNLDSVRADMQRIKNPVNECPGCSKQEQWEDDRTGPKVVTSHHSCKSCYNRR